MITWIVEGGFLFSLMRSLIGILQGKSAKCSFGFKTSTLKESHGDPYALGLSWGLGSKNFFWTLKVKDLRLSKRPRFH